ncbi:MAG: hypothetical protein HRU78_07660 [Gammaproteobacteria bacterium]|nr:MAG: hypothetical protein HRU78_07660 [Gammaproteobacteria bacterium]
MKFDAGGVIDNDHCIVLTHEFLRCDDSFEEFRKYAELMIIQGQTREISYKTYNAYTSFILHLYEFLMGCLARDAKNTDITNKKGDERIRIIEGYVMHHAQRIIDQYRDAIKNGTAPSWVNHINCYDITVPDDFAKDFREFRNKAIGHVAYERASTLSLTEFYQKHHKFLYLLYRESIYWWGQRSEEFPNLKEITEFSVMLEQENA